MFNAGACAARAADKIPRRALRPVPVRVPSGAPEARAQHTRETAVFGWPPKKFL